MDFEMFKKRLPKAKKKEYENYILNINRKCMSKNGSTTLWKNNGLDICTKACAICWDKPIPKRPEDKMKYLANRASTGHTSIFEHSNHVIYLEIPANYRYLKALVELLDAIRYLETSVKFSNKEDSSGNSSIYVLIGGSYAGYLHLFRNIENLDNSILKMIKKNLYENAISAPFEELINDGIMDRDKFMSADAFWTDYETPETPYITHNKGGFDVSDHIYIENIDSIIDFCEELKRICPEFYLFTMMDIIRMVSCTVLFKDMSRTATHQLVRHRNAITQESQRYVDYSNAMFANPATFKPDKYDKDHEYNITFGDVEFKMTLEEIGLAEQGIYRWLKDPDLAGEEYHLLKEDARAFLPSNVICKKLYMTFTYKNLFKFLELRENPHAQAEIRLAAIELGTWLRKYLGDFVNDIYDFTKPFYKLKDNYNETISTNESMEDVSDWVRVVEEDISKEEQNN